MDCSPPGSSVLGISRQGYWSGLPFPSPGNLPKPGIESTSPALAGRFLTTEPLGKPIGLAIHMVILICLNQSIQFSHSVVFDSLQLHGLQHTSLPCLPRTTQSLLKLMSIQLVMPSNHPNLCHPLLLLPSVFPSIRVFSNESVLCFRWPKYWRFSFSISHSNEYSGLISFRMDWFDLLAFQRTLKSLLQHHSLRTSVLWCSAFFRVQLSHSYMTTGKTITLTMPLTAKLVCDQIVLLTNSISLLHLAYSFVCSRYSTDIH